MSAAMQEVAESTSKELAPPARAALALRSAETEKQLQELAVASRSIVTVTNKDGREQCHGALMRLKNTRVEIEKRGKSAREDATKFSKAVIAEEARLIGLISPEELRLQGIRDAWDTEQERLREAAAQAERDRVEALRQRVADIQGTPARLIGATADKIEEAVSAMEAVDVSEASFEEWAPNARAAHEGALAQLRQMHAERVAADAEAERARQEQEAADEACRAEAARLAQVAAEQAAERQRLADQQAAIDKARREQEEREQAERDRAAASAENNAWAEFRIAIADIVAAAVDITTIPELQAALAKVDALSLDSDALGAWYDDAASLRNEMTARIGDRIRKLENERNAREEAERIAAQPPAPEPPPTVAAELTAPPSDEGVETAAAAAEKVMEADEYPGDEAIEQAVAAEYGVSHLTARLWLRRYAEQVGA